MAQSGGTIAAAQGLFSNVTGITAVTSATCSNSAQAANVYTLQLNSNRFTTGACNGSMTGSCQGWQQFVVENTGSGVEVYMQYWLLNYGPTCPASFTPEPGNNCARDSDHATGPSQPASKLQDFRVYATAADPNSGGQDSLYVGLPSGDMIGTTKDANTLGLKSAWKTAEFNIFGDGCSNQVTFNAGVTMQVYLGLTDGAGTPTCIGGGTTGETNTLSLVTPCCPMGSALHGILFSETNVSGTKSVCDCPNGSVWTPNASPSQCICTTPGDVIIDGKCQPGCTPSCPDCAEAPLDDGCGGTCDACSGSCCGGICCGASDTCCTDVCCHQPDVCGGPGLCYPSN